MPNKARSQVRREMELICKLMDKDNLSDEEIIQQLRLNARTFYRYKKRIRKEFAITWKKLNTGNTEYAHARLNSTLEYCIRETKKIIADHNTSQRDRIEAIKTLDVLVYEYAKLERDGPVFKPVLPRIEPKNQETSIR